MNITNNYNQQIVSRGLVPIKDYKGIILQLTKEDKERIAQLLHEKSLLELELERVRSVYSNYKVHSADSTWYEDTLIQINLKIDELKKYIKDIKVNRLKQQQISAVQKKNKLDTNI